MSDEVLLIGSESAGKSTLIKRIREISCIQTNSIDSDNVLGEVITQTIGVDIVDINYFSSVFKIRELGSAISSRWHTYFQESVALVFVIDASDPASWSQAYVFLHESLSFGNCWKGKEILVVLNKVDIADWMTLNACENMLGLDILTAGDKHITIAQGSCVAGSGAGKALAKQVIDWVMKSIHP